MSQIMYLPLVGDKIIACTLTVIFVNPLNAELNPTCHMLAVLGAHHIFHVSGLRVNLLKTLEVKSNTWAGSVGKFLNQKFASFSSFHFPSL